ncbi:MAG TPA: DNA mismatch repair endonuclease MutL [Spirochaetaceae bacterium]|nr:DNA mismatch repair endonuclease MutL [Spirochaetaceae bacterium]
MDIPRPAPPGAQPERASTIPDPGPTAPGVSAGAGPRIALLAPEAAKRIAAGEVIDRPAAALRELLDNALDAGAQNIRVELEGGGIEGLRVADDGFGMGKEDIALCALPHATSKIREADDLLRLSTLGFRGEALASMAAVAHLSITSATEDDQAWRLSASPGKDLLIEPSRGSRGTTVQLRELFSSFPARRQFLKRPAAESAACRQVFIDKALPFPERSFRLTSGEKSLLALKASDLVTRVLEATGIEQPPSFFRELLSSGPGFSARVVAGSPSLYRSDKKHLQVFINKRRVQEYGIAQAIEYAYRGALPGGAWPYAYAFIEVDPALADFNIHPAKKEVRLRNLEDIRRGLMNAIRGYLGGQARNASASILLDGASRAPAPHELELEGLGRTPEHERAHGYTHGSGYGQRASAYQEAAFPVAERSGWAALADQLAARRILGGSTSPAKPSLAGAIGGAGPEAPEPAGYHSRRFDYLGQALGVFLIAQLGEELLLIDQHAAHERILFNEIMGGKAHAQELLVPVVYEPESDEEDEYISDNRESLAALGFRLTKEGSSWLLESAPGMLPSAKTGSLFEVLREKPDPISLVRETAARAACRAAVMDGDELDDQAARALIQKALELPDPHCPHGRPIWLRLSREELFKAVRRLV